MPYGDDFDHLKVMPAEIDEKVITAWGAFGATAPLFRKTSCGVCFAHGVPDYNGHWGVSELCDVCPKTQHALFRDAHRPRRRARPADPHPARVRHADAGGQLVHQEVRPHRADQIRIAEDPFPLDPRHVLSPIK